MLLGDGAQEFPGDVEALAVGLNKESGLAMKSTVSGQRRGLPMHQLHAEFPEATLADVARRAKLGTP